MTSRSDERAGRSRGEQKSSMRQTERGFQGQLSSAPLVITPLGQLALANRNTALGPGHKSCQSDAAHCSRQLKFVL